MPLIDITPFRTDGKRGMTHIIDADGLDGWIERNAMDLLTAGYAKIIVTAHEPTTMVGDRRQKK